MWVGACMGPTYYMFATIDIMIAQSTDTCESAVPLVLAYLPAADAWPTTVLCVVHASSE